MLKNTLGAAPPPVDPGELVEVKSGGSVYYLKVPAERDKLRRQRILTETVSPYHSDSDLLQEVRYCIRHRVSEEQIDGALSTVQSYQEALAAQRVAAEGYAERISTAKDSAAVTAVLEEESKDPLMSIDADLEREYRAIEDFVRQESTRFAGMIADRAEYLAMAPIVAARVLLVRRGKDDGFDRSTGAVPEPEYETLPQPDRDAIQAKALLLFHLGRDAEKNSGSRSGSSTGRDSSISKRKTRKAPSGKSGGAATR